MNPRILSIDVETTPLQAYTWGPKWETNLIEVIEQSRILSYSAKWLDGKHITKGWPDYKGYKKGELDDKKIMQDIWNLLNEADIILAHNGRDFDAKVINTRFVANGLTPPAPYKLIDTKTEAKKYLRLPSNSLDDICDYFKIGRKMEHEGFPLWKKCMAGDKAAWNRMLKYNKQDVVLLEEVYLLLRPWMSGHPTVGMFHNKLVCPRCGSDKIHARGFAVSKTQKYRKFQCQNCASWGRSAIAEERDEKPIVAL